jgi:hypothetical protein
MCRGRRPRVHQLEQLFYEYEGEEHVGPPGDFIPNRAASRPRGDPTWLIYVSRLGSLTKTGVPRIQVRRARTPTDAWTRTPSSSSPLLSSALSSGPALQVRRISRKIFLLFIFRILVFNCIPG